jgi:hypothetical protein
METSLALLFAFVSAGNGKIVGPARRCARLEALASALGLNEQQREEIHQINCRRLKRMAFLPRR